MIKNAKGKVYYGMHFYPGVAEYQEPGKDPYRVFLNEDTIRSMDPSFAGRPIFVEHVDGVDDNIDELRKDADGWVIESFFNSADGKHWAKFIVVSERGESAVTSGMRLSNAYIPTRFGNGGLWNGVTYAKEITGGEYEHLAIVKNPRYEESVILSPEKFKQYNEEKVVELKRLANSKDSKGESKMLKLFKRTKVENSVDIEGMSVVLPKSGKETTLTQLINDMDMMEEAKAKNDVAADMSHKVKMHDGSVCNVGELLEKHKALHDEIEALKKPKAEDEPAVEADPALDNAEDEEEKKKKALQAADEEKELDEAKKKNALDVAAKAAEAKKKADAVRNARPAPAVQEQTVKVEFLADQVARGKSLYGSN